MSLFLILHIDLTYLLLYPYCVCVNWELWELFGKKKDDGSYL